METLDTSLKSFEQMKEEILQFYSEKGVGSPELSAFGDALRVMGGETDARYYRRQMQQHEISEREGQHLVNKAETTTLSAMQLVESHEEFFPGFGDHYHKAYTVIQNAVQAYKRQYAQHPTQKTPESDALTLLRSVRKSVIRSSRRGSH